MKLPWLLSLALCLPAAAQMKAAKVGAWTPPFKAASPRQVSDLHVIIGEAHRLKGMWNLLSPAHDNAHAMGALAESLPSDFFERAAPVLRIRADNASIDALGREILAAEREASLKVTRALDARVVEVAEAVEKGEASAVELDRELMSLGAFSVYGPEATRAFRAYRALAKAVRAGAKGEAAARELAARLRENGVAALGSVEGVVAVPPGPSFVRPRASLSAAGSAAEAAAALKKLAAFAEGSARLAVIEDATDDLRRNAAALETDAALDDAAAVLVEALRRVRFSFGDSAYLKHVGGEDRLMNAEQDLLQAAAALLARYQGEAGALRLRAQMSDPGAPAGLGATREIVLAARSALAAQGMALREKRLRLAKDAAPAPARTPYTGPHMLLIEPAPNSSTPEDIAAFRLRDGRPLAAMPNTRDAKSPAEATAFRAINSARKSIVALAAGGVSNSIEDIAKKNGVKIEVRQMKFLPEGSFMAILDREAFHGGETVIYNRLQAKTIIQREDLGTRLMIANLLKREPTDVERARLLSTLTEQAGAAAGGGVIAASILGWFFGFGVASYVLLLSGAALAAYLLFRQVPK